ncbi:acyltransferase family protein [Bradyrhizobium sp. STM 3557]|uniref:acyltransferase family protein n=1 Tax=Bradyrhizobium sp. STM 3557 TaxID=578920 RepID=UPI00388D7EB7
MLVSVQALRAVAALSVVLCHFSQAQLILSGHGDDWIPLYSLASGVDLFFVISGFIMVHSSEKLFGSPGAPAIFFGRRLSRVVPPYWLATLIALAFAPSVTWASLAGSLFFVPYVSNPTYGQATPLLGVGWTLNYEMMFYVMFAATLMLPRKWALAAVGLALAIMAALGHFGFIDQPTPLRFWCDPIIIEFALGMAIAIAYRKSIKLPALARTLLVLIAVTIIYGFQHHIGGGGMPSNDRLLVWGLPTAMIFTAGVLGPWPSGHPSIQRAVVALGDASYSMYLIHPLVVTAIITQWAHLSHFGLPRVLVVGFAVTIILSLLSYRFIERSAMNGLRILNWTQRPLTVREASVRSAGS